MPTNFVSTLPRLGLYCVWIATGNPRQPLACIWIDPEMRSYRLDYPQLAPAGRVESCHSAKKIETCRDRTPTPSKRLVTFKTSRHSQARRSQVALCFALVVLVVSVLLSLAWADVGGRIAGVVTDPSSAFLSGATATITNSSNRTKQTATTNDQGQYSFPVVPVGKYELEISAPGFQTYKKTDIGIDVNTALQIDAGLKIQQSRESMEVSDSVVTVQMSDTEIGETIASQQVVDMPLNGRSYTDLLATQAGVSPVTTSGAANSTSGGGFGTVPVAGNENTGQFSINGQREAEHRAEFRPFEKTRVRLITSVNRELARER